jgi:hypothetical protein
MLWLVWKFAEKLFSVLATVISALQFFVVDTTLTLVDAR